MHGFTRETTIDAAPKDVFEAITDLERAKEYIPTIVKTEMLTDGPFGLGTKWKETRGFKLLGFIPMRASSTLEVTAFEPGRAYSVTFDDGCNWVLYAFTVAPEGDRTRLSLACECKGVGKYAGNDKVADKLANMMQKYDGDLLDRIKAYLERPAVVAA